MKRLFLVLALLLISFQFVACDDDVTLEKSEDAENNTNDDLPEGAQKFEFKQDGEQDLQEQLQQWQQQMQQQQAFERNAIAICLIVSKSRMTQFIDQIQELLKSQSDSTALYKKIQTEHINTCLKGVQPEEFGQLAQEINSNNFDIKNYEQKFIDLTIERYQNTELDLALTEEEQKIDKIAGEWEQEWREKQQDMEEEELLKNSQQQFNIDDYEPKLFGISYKQIPASFKFLLVLGVIGAVFGVIYFGYLTLNKEEKLLTKKQKKLAKKQN